jgi:hypothetical protein
MPGINSLGADIWENTKILRNKYGSGSHNNGGDILGTQSRGSLSISKEVFLWCYQKYFGGLGV